MSPVFYPRPQSAGTWWAEAVEAGEQVQAGAARAAGLGQAFIVIGLAAGARVARRTEAVEGAGGVEAGAAVFTGPQALLGWKEGRAGSTGSQSGWPGSQPLGGWGLVWQRRRHQERAMPLGERTTWGGQLGMGRRPRGEEMPNLDRCREEGCLCF